MFKNEIWIKNCFGTETAYFNFLPQQFTDSQVVNPRKQGSVVGNADTASSYAAVVHLSIATSRCTFAHRLPEILQLIPYVLILL